MEQLARDVWVQRIVAEGFPTLSAVVLTASGPSWSTRSCDPRTCSPCWTCCVSAAASRRVVVVNTHHHWDHVYGNAAFSDVDIVAQRGCPRLITAQSLSGSETIPLEPPEGVPLPTITFGDRLLYADEAENVNLLHTPGHTEDSLVVYLAQARVLLRRRHRRVAAAQLLAARGAGGVGDARFAGSSSCPWSGWCRRTARR